MDTFSAIIWGKDVQLEVVFDVYAGETISADQLSASDFAHKNISCVNDVYDAVKRYCAEDDTRDDSDEIIEDIYDVLVPEAIYLPRKNNGMRFMLFCDYAFDPDHGLALVFDGKKLKTICSQAAVL